MSVTYLVIGCAYCGKSFRSAMNARYCDDCHRAASKVRSAAQFATRKAVTEGKLPPIWTQYCVDCGRFADRYDHRDYAFPLKVEPVCRSCNTKRGPAKYPTARKGESRAA